MTRIASIVAALIVGAASAQSPSPYSGQETRDIKALSPQEVSDYLAGKGMGLAKAAELNGYPGPAHVLELAKPLALSAEQRTATEAIFKRMEARAIPLGRDLVEEERSLDQMFATRAIDDKKLAVSLARIGRLSGQVREAHLQAHLEEAALLTPQQIARYKELRGYAGGAAHDHAHGHMGH